ASDRNEGAIAGMLWDFFDNVNDGQDTVSHGETRIQQVYASANFRNNKQCDMRSFLSAWKALGMPTDAATAATVVQNVGINKPFGVAAAQAPQGPVQAAVVDSAADPLDYRWWDQITMMVDNSTSMGTGPAGGPIKLDAVKSLIHEQVNDLAPAPRGTEFNLYEFNATAPSIPVLAGRFFADGVLPTVDGLAATGADGGCPVRALTSVIQAIDDKVKGDIWLYTDGDTADANLGDLLRQRLTQQELHSSFVVLGGCSPLATRQSDVSGGEKNYLGLAADGSQPIGIVPYLVTALSSGGQFLFVAPEQLSDAVDILRAQWDHSAGAGKWSDYVSNYFTYRWDRLDSWEYNWIDAVSGGTYLGEPNNQGLYVSFVPAFPYFFTTEYGYLYDSGFMVMGNNHDLGSPSLSILSGPLDWQLCGPAAAANAAQAASPNAVNCDYRVSAYSKQEGDWFAVTTTGKTAIGEPRAYQVLFNAKTGEIRYQYQTVYSADVSNAHISLDDSEYNLYAGSVEVANKSPNGASNGMGYKFTPAPPQPTKSYTVTVDSLMSAIGFLQTGYSGSFGAMQVQRPDGSAVDCNDTANVLCVTLNNGLVQYVQVNTNGQNGIYTATISVGASGQGTFSFNALAASAINVRTLGKRTLSLSPHAFQVDLGRAADDNALQGWLQTSVGTRLGEAFQLYDDGAHNDGAASDGLFGSDAFTPPAAGVAYLWTQGQLDGVAITRADPTPFNFQAVEVAPVQDNLEGYYDEAVTVAFHVTNQDSVSHCYVPQFDAPDGWSTNTLYTPSFCVPAGGTATPTVDVGRESTADAKGETGGVIATFTEAEAGRIVSGDAAQVSLFRKPAGIEFDNRWTFTSLRPNSSDTVSMTVKLLDDQGELVGRSLDVNYQIETTLGAVTATGHFTNGRMPVQFTAGDQTGNALITLTVDGGLTATTTLQIRFPTAATLALTATPSDLSNGANSAILVATALDGGGNPVNGQLVRFSVSDDKGDQGTINSGEVFTSATNLQGQATTTFVKTANGQGQVAVRAEALVADGAGFRV
ncbi:MAG: Ig-like domain-containing protein, partial [Caldilineaceae bacterium]|nr:Ig-like domain-containing protein [Caldilineaceae bacterium]